MAYKIAFSGHRPNKLGGWDWDASFNIKIRKYFKNLIENMIKTSKHDALEFYSGIALGFDMYMAEVIIELRRAYPSIKLIAALPCFYQSIIWPEYCFIKHEELLKECDKAIMIDELEEYKVPWVQAGEYHAEKMKNRNEYMSEIMDIGIVLWDGTRGSTFHFIERAIAKGKEIKLVNPREI